MGAISRKVENIMFILQIVILVLLAVKLFIDARAFWDAPKVFPSALAITMFLGYIILLLHGFSEIFPNFPGK